MAGRILGTFDADSTEWHAARAGRIGGSDIGAIMGWSPWQTRDQLLTDKATAADPKPPNKAMKRGHLLEPAVLAFLCDKHGLTLDTEASAATWQHDRQEWAIANPDGITTNGLLLEAKTTADRCDANGWGRAGTDKVPLHYVAQVTWCMAITGTTHAYLGVLAGAHNGRPSLDFASYRIGFDADLFNLLIDEAADFMADLQALTAKEAA